MVVAPGGDARVFPLKVLRNLIRLGASLWSGPRAVRLPAQVLDHLALEDPDLDPMVP